MKLKLKRDKFADFLKKAGLGKLFDDAHVVVDDSGISSCGTDRQRSVFFDVKFSGGIEIEGSGNLNRINDFDLNLPSSFEIFDPEITQKLNLTSKGYNGKKIFNYLIIPRESGEFEIPKHSLTYFNPNTNKYETNSAPGFTVKVNVDSSAQANILLNQGVKKNEETFEDDINKKINWLSNTTFYQKWWFWLVALSPFGLAFYFFFLRKKLKSRVKKVNAIKEAKELLNSAELELSNNNESAFYANILQAWQLFLCEKLNLKLSAFNKVNIKAKFGENNNSTAVLSILNQLEMVKYAPIETKGKEKILQESKALMDVLNQEL